MTGDPSAGERKESAERSKATWRSRLVPHPPKGEDNYSVEIIVTLVLGFALLTINGRTDIQEPTRLALEIFVIAVELLFMFGRFVLRRLERARREATEALDGFAQSWEQKLDALARDSMAVIPRNRLGSVLYHRLDKQRTELLIRAQELAEHQDHQLHKTSVYHELIGLTDAVADLLGEHPNGTVQAVSSRNIEDFDDEPLAEAYLAANRRAATRGVVVQRIFLLDDDQRDDPQVARVIQTHAAGFGGTGGGTESGARWVMKKHVRHTLWDDDLALFANEVVVLQLTGDRFEITQQEQRVQQARDSFNRLWNHAQAHDAADLTARAPRPR